MKKIILQRNQGIDQPTSTVSSRVDYFSPAYRCNSYDSESTMSAEPVGHDRPSDLLESEDSQMSFSQTSTTVSPGLSTLVSEVSSSLATNQLEEPPRCSSKRSGDVVAKDTAQTQADWLAQFKMADFGPDYGLRPRAKRPRYDLQIEEPTNALQNVRKRWTRIPPKPAVVVKQERHSTSLKLKLVKADKSSKLTKKVPPVVVKLGRGKYPRSRDKPTEQKKGVGNGIQCVCSSNWDIGPQIECEKCGLWQHMFCMGMFGKSSDGYSCYNCDKGQALPCANHEEALKAFSAYAFSLPVTDESGRRALQYVPETKETKGHRTRAPGKHGKPRRECSAETAMTSEPERLEHKTRHCRPTTMIHGPPTKPVCPMILSRPGPVKATELPFRQKLSIKIVRRDGALYPQLPEPLPEGGDVESPKTKPSLAVEQIVPPGDMIVDQSS